MIKYEQQDELHTKLELQSKNQLSSINTREILALGNECLAHDEYQEAIKLYQTVIDRESAGSLKWLEASKKLGDINFAICKKLISDKDFKANQLSNFVVSNTDDITQKEKILISTSFCNAKENYHQCIQKIFRSLKDVYNFDKNNNLLEDSESVEIRHLAVKKIINIISKSLQLNKFFYTEMQKNTLDLEYLGHRFLDAINSLSQQLSDVCNTCNQTFIGELVVTKSVIDSELHDCYQIASSMLGDTNEIA